MQDVRGSRVWSLGLEDPLEKEMAAHSSILAWEISGTEEPGGPQSMGSQRVRYNCTHPAQHTSYAMPFIFGNKEFNFFFFFATLQGLWDLSSPTRDWTWTLALKAAHLNPGPPGNYLEIRNVNFEVRVLRCHILNLFFSCIFSVFHWLVIIFL